MYTEKKKKFNRMLSLLNVPRHYSRRERGLYPSKNDASHITNPRSLADFRYWVRNKGRSCRIDLPRGHKSLGVKMILILLASCAILIFVSWSAYRYSDTASRDTFSAMTHSHFLRRRLPSISNADWKTDTSSHQGLFHALLEVTFPGPNASTLLIRPGKVDEADKDSCPYREGTHEALSWQCNKVVLASQSNLREYYDQHGPPEEAEAEHATVRFHSFVPDKESHPQKSYRNPKSHIVNVNFEVCIGSFKTVMSGMDLISLIQGKIERPRKDHNLWFDGTRNRQYYLEQEHRNTSQVARKFAVSNDTLAYHAVVTDWYDFNYDLSKSGRTVITLTSSGQLLFSQTRRIHRFATRCAGEMGRLFGVVRYFLTTKRTVRLPELHVSMDAFRKLSTLSRLRI